MIEALESLFPVSDPTGEATVRVVSAEADAGGWWAVLRLIVADPQASPHLKEDRVYLGALDVPPETLATAVALATAAGLATFRSLTLYGWGPADLVTGLADHGTAGVRAAGAVRAFRTHGWVKSRSTGSIARPLCTDRPWRDVRTGPRGTIAVLEAFERDDCWLLRIARDGQTADVVAFDFPDDQDPERVDAYRRALAAYHHAVLHLPADRYAALALEELALPTALEDPANDGEVTFLAALVERL
ncbi:MAG: hypothetical protein KC656_01415 [Myxococcales bacterium]|nr:hypothetical protein [Myxococcales bacterium]